MDAATTLGFDVGSKRIGVAIANPLAGAARELAVLELREGRVDWDAVQALVDDWRPAAFVVGDPLQLDGEAPDQPNRLRARAFARSLRGRFGLPVWMVDERDSSNEAARRFAGQRAQGARRRRDAAQLDALAAVVILERWQMQPDSATEVS